MSNTLSPLYPSATYQTSKDLNAMRSVAVYAVATLARALGTIEGAQLDTKHANRVVWAEMDAATGAKSGAQALANVATIYANRAGGTTALTGQVDDAAGRIWQLAQRQATEADPSRTFDALREELSQAAGLVLALLENTPTPNKAK